MRVLPDECLPRRFADEFPERFDAFLTIDAGISLQQNAASLAIGVIALKAQSNRIEDRERIEVPSAPRSASSR